MSLHQFSNLVTGAVVLACAAAAKRAGRARAADLSGGFRGIERFPAFVVDLIIAVIPVADAMQVSTGVIPGRAGGANPEISFTNCG